MRAIDSHSEAAPPSGLVFDVDGTLIDTLPAWRHALNALLASIGRSPWTQDAVRRELSQGVTGLLMTALPATLTARGVPDEYRLAFLRLFSDLADRHARPYPGADALLRAVHDRGCPLGICSNGSGSTLHDLLTTFGWTGLFRVVMHADNSPALKPDPGPLQRAAGSMELDPTRLWMIGDSDIDAACAQAAGTPFVWVAHGYGSPTGHRRVMARVATLAGLRPLLGLPEESRLDA